MEIKVVKNVLAANENIAQANRELFEKNRVLVLNMISSPGAGKTLIIEKTLEAFAGDVRMGVIEGDITTTLDAERLKKYDVPIVQINTETFGGDCHLDANMIANAVKDVDLTRLDALFIENVGNLVCPAEFNVGEDCKIAVASIPEGVDKPLKYPLVFIESKLAIINKIDLESVLEFDTEKLKNNILKVNPKIEIMSISAKTGAGFDGWLKWLKLHLKK